MSEGTGVFLTPSGSDAEYIPLIIAKAIHGQDKKIVNIVTCNDEVGSGTLGASGGRFFSPLEPIPGYTGHMDVVEMDSPVLGLAENVETVTVQARLASGEVVDAKPEIIKALEEAAIKDAMPIVHSVFGSKTGICQELHDFAAEQVTVAGGLYVVDACQGRFPDRMVADLLEQGVIVLITGSKFYRGPPFSGGCLVPSCIMEALKEIQKAGELPPIAKGLNTFIGKSEIPRELHGWRDTIEDNMNPGLALRWEAGLAEMEATLAIDENKRLAAIDHWRKQVIDHINKFENLDYFSAAEDTKSIVSLRVIHPDTGKWMIKSELAKVFKALTLDLSEQFPEVDDVVSRICFTGQPVHISKDEAVLRIALGSDSLREVIKNLEQKQTTASQTDLAILEKMSFISYKFNEL